MRRPFVIRPGLKENSYGLDKLNEFRKDYPIAQLENPSFQIDETILLMRLLHAYSAIHLKLGLGNRAR
jgi:hypothetical protein